MKTIIGFIANLFFNEDKFVNKIKLSLASQLTSLKNELESLSINQSQDNYVEKLVSFFGIISVLQDQNFLKNEIEILSRKKLRFHKNIEYLNNLKNLKEQISMCGRGGMNRTPKGEKVTAENIFLGDVFGIWTKSASYWLINITKLQSDVRNDISTDNDNPVTTWYIINNYQAKSFLLDHYLFLNKLFLKLQ